MPSERMQRRIDALLDEADASVSEGAWTAVAEKARAVLAIDAANEDATSFLQMATANGVSAEATVVTAGTASQSSNAASADTASTEAHAANADQAAEPARSVIEAAAIVEELEATEATSAPADPESFAGDRYKVLRFLGEGGKKRVFLAHDALLDRDIAFSLIKTEGLDDVGRERIMREARAMGRLTHQNIVAIFDIGEHTAPDGTRQPFLVQELMGGGDVEGLLEDADGPLPLQQALDIGIATARGLEFAHAQNVIHRDLKPGNVWLTADGVAKIGDLGLAVTLGQSRLTSHGMMVGTYGYMPPEQALGQEVTPQADLYSLGAMLYELVTGRPPFLGDTPTAVISQHLNNQPVAPSWYSDHCPPELERLILRLLAKVPADRPADAVEVIAALEAVDPTGRSASHSDSGANPLDRLARGVFVGRERELEQLRESLDSAMQGRGSVVMLVGEPGIGKTRTTQELETYARMRGANVFWGRTHESAGMPAYWPWIQVGRAWGATQDFAANAAAGGGPGGLGGNFNPEMVRLFPELKAVVPGLEDPPPLTDDAAAQFQLFDAYSQFIRGQSAQQPWVIVLDDLHWADKPTLQLLAFVSRELSNMHALVIATYRDTDLVRTHPLSEALSELNREGGFTRVNLRGLDRDEVGAYLAQRASVKPVPALVDRVYEETEGNPFFLSEVVNVMAEEGSLSTESVSDIALPDGVREALGRRLDRLSEDANELLGVAAIIGREFAYETLTLLGDRDDAALLALIEEALRARVIEEGDQAGRYRFTHALMQETLLDELSTTRRVMLHGQVGEALERRWGDRADQYASRLARHFSEAASLTPRHAGRAVHYLRQAAELANSRSGWGEALRLYAKAISLTDLGDGFAPGEVAALHEAAMYAGFNDSDFRSALRHGLTAVNSYRELSDRDGQARATLPCLGPFITERRTRLLIDDALAFEGGPRDPILRANLLAGRARTNHAGGESDVQAALDLLEGADPSDPLGVRARMMVTLWQSQVAFSQHQPAAEFLRTRMEEFRAYPLNNLRGGVFVTYLPATFVDDGLDASLAVADEFRQWAADRHDWLFAETAAEATANLLRLSGRLEEASAMLETAGDRSFVPAIGRLKLSLVRGDADGIRSSLPRVELAGASTIWQRWAHANRALGYAFLGESDAAEAELDAFTAVFESISEFESNLFGFVGPWNTDLQVAIVDYGLAAPEYAVESIFDENWHWNMNGSVDRWRGKLLLRRGDLEGAERWLEAGAASSRERGIELELGRCIQDLADLAEAQGQHELALARLEEAGEIYSRLGAGGYLNEVIARKEILKA